jgi:hypothetical protein
VASHLHEVLCHGSEGRGVRRHRHRRRHRPRGRGDVDDAGAGSRTEILEAVPADLVADESNFNDVASGSSIETG